MKLIVINGAARPRQRYDQAAQINKGELCARQLQAIILTQVGPVTPQQHICHTGQPT